ncbi:hypothetical protein C8R41DRAFT_921389 [Lentinula lateritia]|uniref:Uncharacterized protein n=1 Tax=Lentinula lateritia TaxID=40482 RepID=A0ABQ8VB43_9AGAR|nr:hypothetical protein C8R41DRAFT_921389 [Lentinula lateritia]
MLSNILSSPSNYEPSESSGSPLKLIKRKRTWYSSLETSNLTSAQEDEESSNEEGMKLRPPSSSGRKQISLLYNLGIEDSQVETQHWTEGMRCLNEDKITFTKSRRPSPSEDVHFSQRPHGWFGSDELNPVEDDAAAAVGKDAEVKIKDGPQDEFKHARILAAENSQLVIGVTTLKCQNEKLQAHVDRTLHELKDTLARNTQLTCLLDQSRTHSTSLSYKINSLLEKALEKQAKVNALTGIIARTGDIFVEFASGTFGGEKLHMQMNSVLLNHLEGSQV